jgi:hypothetical protein
VSSKKPTVGSELSVVSEETVTTEASFSDMFGSAGPADLAMARKLASKDLSGNLA